ncbi:hypothetical protein BH23BAC3_BH23BAC3_14590 [soil metagenome]
MIYTTVAIFGSWYGLGIDLVRKRYGFDQARLLWFEMGEIADVSDVNNFLTLPAARQYRMYLHLKQKTLKPVDASGFDHDFYSYLSSILKFQKKRLRFSKKGVR